MKASPKFVQTQRQIFDRLVKDRDEIEDQMRIIARRIAFGLCPFDVGQTLTNGNCYWKIVAIFPTGHGLGKGKKLGYGMTVDRVTKEGRHIRSDLLGQRRYITSDIWGPRMLSKLRKYRLFDEKSKLHRRVRHGVKR